MTFVFTLINHFFFDLCCDHLHLHSFPTRRSSDLSEFTVNRLLSSWQEYKIIQRQRKRVCVLSLAGLMGLADTKHHVIQRSEEHTSELQSRQYLVCRLLLEKKN